MRHSGAAENGESAEKMAADARCYHEYIAAAPRQLHSINLTYTLLTLKQSNFSASNASSGAVGSGGTQTLTFVAKSAGTVNLQLKYWRSFAGDKSIARRFAATIQIQA
ncbi:MAG: hypothetical protein NVS4B9_32000 [Ktedonobacteraceae bacterium]